MTSVDQSSNHDSPSSAKLGIMKMHSSDSVTDPHHHHHHKALIPEIVGSGGEGKIKSAVQSNDGSNKGAAKEDSNNKRNHKKSSS